MPGDDLRRQSPPPNALAASDRPLPTAHEGSPVAVRWRVVGLEWMSAASGVLGFILVVPPGFDLVRFVFGRAPSIPDPVAVTLIALPAAIGALFGALHLLLRTQGVATGRPVLAVVGLVAGLLALAILAYWVLAEGLSF